jgi:hypothetical protein
MGGEQTHAQRRFAHAPASVDARPQRKAQIRGRGRAPQLAGVDQRGHADVLALGHYFQALRDKGAVEPMQRGDIGHRAQRHQIEQRKQRAIAGRAGVVYLVQLAPHRDGQQEGHANRRQMAMRRADLAFIEPVWVHHRHGTRQLMRAFVVIDHDHLHPGIRRHGQRIMRHGAAIDRDDQLRAFLPQPHQSLAAGAIALQQAVGDVVAGIMAAQADQADQQRGAGGAIDVVIAIDRHRLALDDGLSDAAGGHIHILKMRGVGQELTQGGAALT